MLTHASLVAAVTATAAARPVAPDAVYGYPFPLCHVAGYNVLLHHHHRRPVVLLPGFSPTVVCEAIARHRITTISLAPTMVASLIDDPARSSADLSSLRTVSYGASAMPTEVLRLAVERLGCDFTQGYGMTELSGNAVFLGAEEHRRALSDQPHLLGAAGRPAPGVDLRILDDGEIAVRAAQVMAGYWEDEEATASSFAEGGWFRTGDIGRLDGDGNLYVIDRKKDVIVTGGENVSSIEVEDCLHGHPDVADVAVIGVPHERWGETVLALVVPREGRHVDGADLIAFARDRMAGFKCPTAIEVREALPRTATGKIQKFKLRAPYWAERPEARPRAAAPPS
jgi:acyl-CoA synthetase (AMP-forming)/AMP-acid ligase II